MEGTRGVMVSALENLLHSAKKIDLVSKSARVDTYIYIYIDR